jgi:NAD(P)-dependent dehydrogenase (short-subunit alcohol dehydrogenase family)
LEELQSLGLKAMAVLGDVSQPNDCKHIVREAIDAFGQIDILVNNVGVSVVSVGVEEVSPETYLRVAETNYLSAIYMTCEALPYIRISKGSILFNSSLAGVTGFPENAAYCSAKMALTGFAESLRRELIGSKVHVGIAFLCHTENTEGKMVLAARGGLTPKVNSYSIKLAPIDMVSAQVIQMLHRRKFKRYFSFWGKVLGFMSRYAPSSLHLLFVLYRKRMKQQVSSPLMPAMMEDARLPTAQLPSLRAR